MIANSVAEYTIADAALAVLYFASTSAGRESERPNSTLDMFLQGCSALYTIEQVIWRVECLKYPDSDAASMHY
jgi:hypothetical protein